MAGTDISRISSDFLRQSPAGHGRSVQHGRRNGKLIDYDDLGRQLRLEKVRQGLTREQIHFHPAAARAVEKSLAQRSLQASRPARVLTPAELNRHEKLTGAQPEIAQKALALLRNRQLPQGRPAGAGRGALQEYLALQKLKLALAAGDDAEFAARLLPLPDFSGGADALARRFYQASDDDAQLDELLAGFALDHRQRAQLKEKIRQCPHHHATGYHPEGLASVLAQAIGIDEARPSGAAAQSRLAGIDDRLAELEGDDTVGRYVSGALNIADEAEKSADPARFADDYADLIHGNESWGEKCAGVLDRYMQQGRGDDLTALPRTLEAASRAADLDLHADFPSTDKLRLQAAIGSLSLIARMRTVSEAVEDAVRFMERHHGKSIRPVELLRGVLDIFANPYGAALSLSKLASQLNLKLPDQSITLFREVGKAVRLMQQIFVDANASDAAQTGVQDALDNAIAHEEMLLDQAERGQSGAPEPADGGSLPAMPAPHLMP